MLLNNYDNVWLLETDRIIIEQVNAHPEIFLNLPIIKFAQKMNFSLSTISKSVRRLGFKNYRDFQCYLDKSYCLQKETNMRNMIMDPNKNDILLLKELDFFVLNETIKLINYQTLNDLATRIIVSHKIWVFGVGNNFYAAKDLASSLNIIGSIAFFTNDLLDSNYCLHNLGSDDLVIFISERYNRKEYQSLISELKQQHVKIAVITALDKFFLNQDADYVLNYFIFSQKTLPKLIDNNKIQQFFINNLLINTIVKKQNLVIDWEAAIQW